MSTSSRLQFATDELVRTRKLGAIAYAAGQTAILGATAPQYRITVTDGQKVALKLAKVIHPWLCIQFHVVSATGSTPTIDVYMGGGSQHAYASPAAGVYTHLADMTSEVLGNISNYMIELRVSGTGASIVMNDVIVMGLPSADIPLGQTPTSTS